MTDQTPRRRAWQRRALLVGVFAVASVGWLVIATGVILDGHSPQPFTWSVQADRSGLSLDGAIVSDSGSSVQLLSGSAGVFTATLLPCEHEHGWRAWIGAGIAGAGHGDGDGEDTTARGPTIVDLATDAAVELGGATAVEPNYCQAHAAFAASSAAQRLAGEAEPTLSLRLRHTTIDGVSTIFAAESTSPTGGSIDLAALEITNNATLRIDMAALLHTIADQIDSGQTSPETLGAAGLAGLSSAMSVVASRG